MPKRGDKLYRCCDGQLKVVIFVEESIAEGAFVPTWVVREKGQASRCSVDSYFTTEKEAWKAELENYKQGLKNQIKYRNELNANIKETRKTLAELRKKVAA